MHLISSELDLEKMPRELRQNLDSILIYPFAMLTSVCLLKRKRE